MVFFKRAIDSFQEPVSLKFMLSYTMDDETFTEMGEVDTLPHL